MPVVTWRKTCVKCKITRNCFVGDTEVLVYDQVPEQIAATWHPLETEAEQSRSTTIGGVWFALTATGVAIAVAREVRRFKKTVQKPGLQFADTDQLSTKRFDTLGLPFATNENLAVLRRMGQTLVESVSGNPSPQFAMGMAGADTGMPITTMQRPEQKSEPTKTASSLMLRFNNNDVEKTAKGKTGVNSKTPSLKIASLNYP